MLDSVEHQQKSGILVDAANLKYVYICLLVHPFSEKCLSCSDYVLFCSKRTAENMFASHWKMKTGKVSDGRGFNEGRKEVNSRLLPYPFTAREYAKLKHTESSSK